jgi:hypothetical protein
VTIDERPRQAVEIRTFGGLNTARDKHEIAPGDAQVQINVGIDTADQLEVRRGYRVVRFDQE